MASRLNGNSMHQGCFAASESVPDGSNDPSTLGEFFDAQSFN